GSVTVKSVQGSLSILDQDRAVLAALSSKESVTIPSITAKRSPKVMVAQAGETGTGNDREEFLGLSPWTWAGIGLATVAVGVVVLLAVSKDEDHDRIPICPP
ncbi:MAG: hypothetical protein AB1502_13840, partial [Thermodesulfobacteriota bacterium]